MNFTEIKTPIKRFLTALLPLVLLFAPYKDVVCGELSGSLHTISQASDGERVRVIVFLNSDNPQPAFKSAIAREMGRTELHKAVYNELKSESLRTSEKFERTIVNSGLNIDIFKNYWITDAALVEVDASQLDALANLDDVDFVAPDTTLALIEPASIEAAPASSEGASDNLRTIGADKLWARGLTGEGRLIGSFDTGVQGDHPALNSKWRGNYIDDPSAAWFDPYGSTFPGDGNGHGTHVMGILVGSTDGDTIGMAFNAQWISASVIDRGSGLSQTISDILSAFEWAADPDGNPETMDDVPDVICHSWGIPQGIFPACDNTFWTAIDNLESLGIVCVFAAGNEGPDSMTLRFPADRATAPLNAFAVGAINQTDPNYTVANFSSRGPSSCDESRIKPEVVAPGISIRSAYKGSTYRLISGTSMAAPHVAGAVALLRQYNPEATSEQIKQALYESATDLGPAGEDNAYGNGMINLEAALALIPPPNSPDLLVQDFSADDGGNGILEAGEQFNLSLTILSQYASAENLWARIFISDGYATALEDSAYFGAVAVDGIADNSDNPFVIQLNNQIIPASNIYIDVNFYDAAGNLLGTRRIGIIVGQSQNARILTMSNSQIQLTVDNFGGIGHGVNSPSPSGVIGFSPLDMEFDILPEFSLMIATENDTRVSDASRSEAEFISDNDFMASRQIPSLDEDPGTFGDRDFFGYYNDSLAADPMGISIIQRTSLFDDPDLSRCVMIEYDILPQLANYDDIFHVGFLMDWDLGADGSGNEKSAYSYEGDFSYFYNQDNNLYVGVRFLNQSVYGYRIMPNIPGGKSLLSDAEKYEYLTTNTISPGIDKWSDYYGVISTRTQAGSVFDTVKVALAVAVGTSLDELQQTFTKAYDFYNITTDVDTPGDNANLPTGFELGQNYPNPFNMSTNISFNLPSSGHVTLDVYNLLGQKVVTLADDQYPAGMVTINWDGRDKSGDELASGTYFYRVIFNGHETASKKLMILK